VAEFSERINRENSPSEKFGLQPLEEEIHRLRYLVQGMRENRGILTPESALELLDAISRVNDQLNPEANKTEILMQSDPQKIAELTQVFQLIKNDASALILEELPRLLEQTSKAGAQRGFDEAYELFSDVRDQLERELELKDQFIRSLQVAMETLEQQMSPQSPLGLNSVRERHNKILSEIKATSTQVKKVQQTVDRLRNWSSFCITVAIITTVDLFVRSTSLLKQWFPVLNSDYFPFLVSGGLILTVALLNWRALEDEYNLKKLQSEQSELIGKKKLLEELFPTLKDGNAHNYKNADY
jgi:hypothetical protein